MRRGIEQGEYVYRRGDLLFGPGDPPAAIVIDEQSMIFTMAYAKNFDIWPRKADEPSESKPDGEKLGRSDETDDSRAWDPKTEPVGSHPVGKAPGAFTAEGVLREALVKLWEQARANGVETIGVLTIRMFEAGDAFRLLGAVGAVTGAKKIVTITGGYETSEGGSFELEFRGSVSDAQPVREFLEPQLRAASSRSLEAGFEMTFESGLAMKGDAAEKLTESLGRFASGAAYVSAMAEVKT